MSSTLSSFDLEQHQAQRVLSRLCMQQQHNKEHSSPTETQGTQTVEQDLVDGGY